MCRFGLTEAVNKAVELAHHEKTRLASGHCLDGVSRRTLMQM
jgi:hypothetical protein